MTPTEALTAHQAQRPEMPRGCRANDAAFVAWHQQFSEWVAVKETLDRAVACEGIALAPYDHSAPACTPRADYEWRDMKPGRRTNRPAWSEPGYMAKKKAENRAKRGGCRDCGQPPVKDRSRCQRCLERNRIGSRERKDARRAQVREAVLAVQAERAAA